MLWVVEINEINKQNSVIVSKYAQIYAINSNKCWPFLLERLNFINKSSYHRCWNHICNCLLYWNKSAWLVFSRKMFICFSSCFSAVCYVWFRSAHFRFKLECNTRKLIKTQKSNNIQCSPKQEEFIKTDCFVSSI